MGRLMQFGQAYGGRVRVDAAGSSAARNGRGNFPERVASRWEHRHG